MKARRFAMASLLCFSCTAFAAGGEGLTTPIKLAPYDAARPPCKAPTGLQKKLVFAQDNKREFMQGVGRGLEAAARARGLGYHVAFADNDPALMIKHVDGIVSDKTGAIVVAPIHPPSLAPALKKVFGAG